MDVRTARMLGDLTSDFYRLVAQSFSETRQSAWSGWGICLDLARSDLLRGRGRDEGLLLLDLACGNLRFERFLAEAIAPVRLDAYTVDNCDVLVRKGTDCVESPASFSVHNQSMDLLDALFGGSPLATSLEAEPCDLSVCFGFMHHVPLPEQRVEVLRALVDKTRCGGYVMASFWCFMDDPKFAQKARAVHERAVVTLGLPDLPANDCVLSWQNKPDVYRYCHSFEQAEINALVEAVAPRAQEVARFRADGKSARMNTYVVLKVR